MSYEKSMAEKDPQAFKADQYSIGLLKYLWKAGPLSSRKENNIPAFLKKVEILASLTDLERFEFGRYLHLRKFSPGEVIFSQGDLGHGFYFILSGRVDIQIQSTHEGEEKTHSIVQLGRGHYFGEMGLLQQLNYRNASAITLENTELLGLFRPDLEKILSWHPVIGAKFLRGTSLILANRVASLVDELATYKHQQSKS